MSKLELVTSLIVAGALATGCKWTEFDDLANETWVSVTAKPNKDSSDYGVAMARGASTSASGGTLVVIGSAQAQYTELTYSATGASDLAPTALKLNSQFGVGNLDAQPILLAAPTGDEVSLIVNGGGQIISVLHGKDNLVPYNVFGPAMPDAAAYVQPPPRSDAGHVGEAQPPQPIVGSGDSVYGSFLGMGPTVQPKAALVDDAAAAVQIRGIAGARITSTTYDDLVVWSASGKLLIYDGNLGWGATLMSGPLAGSAAVDTMFQPGKGSQLISIDNKYVLLVGHKDSGPDSMLALYDVTAMNGAMRTPTRIGNPIMIPDLRCATILDTNGQRYVVAGYPTATYDGVKAGRVLVFALSTATGIAETPAMTLHDAQPETDQVFGRSVAVMPYNGKQVIAVGADNEIFVYFRTLLYNQDTRTGK